VSVETRTNWLMLAARSSEALQECYWNPVTCLFENSYGPSTDKRFHYWWQAHALDSLIDAFEQTENNTYLSKADSLLQGIVVQNKGSITNDYYDDMQWLALALLRLYDVTREKKYLEHVQTLWQDIQTGWNEHCGGGIAWRKMQVDYKNTPANAPAIILAARLYQRFQDKADFELALKIYVWLQKNLVDPETGFVWDGMNRLGDGKIDKDWKFTYCQGVVIGSGLELYHITKDKMYLQQAERTARVALEVLCDDEGTLPDESGGDGGLFKGIFVRYLTLLLLEKPFARGVEVLRHNGNLVAGLKSELAGTNWKRELQDSIELSTALSGVMLLESLAKLEKVGTFSPRVS
jgi:predicted alpha-1,6-mannanase (GH76 family)